MDTGLSLLNGLCRMSVLIVCTYRQIDGLGTIALPEFSDEEMSHSRYTTYFGLQCVEEPGISTMAQLLQPQPTLPFQPCSGLAELGLINGCYKGVLHVLRKC